MTESNGVRLEQVPDRTGGRGYGLGRHIEHDARSLDYAIAAWPWSQIKSKHWERRIPVLDQGEIGSCTAESATGWAGTDNKLRRGITHDANGAALDQKWALEFYQLETKTDNIPGYWAPDDDNSEDTGSTGLAAAKTLKKCGLATGYKHAFSVKSAAKALQDGPIMVGIPWYESMFTPNPDGALTVSPSSGLAGGHEVIVDQIEVLNSGSLVYWLTNSWGTSWGQSGRAYLTDNSLSMLLRADGDVTQPH